LSAITFTTVPEISACSRIGSCKSACEQCWISALDFTLGKVWQRERAQVKCMTGQSGGWISVFTFRSILGHACLGKTECWAHHTLGSPQRHVHCSAPCLFKTCLSFWHWCSAASCPYLTVHLISWASKWGCTAHVLEKVHLYSDGLRQSRQGAPEMLDVWALKLAGEPVKQAVLGSWKLPTLLLVHAPRFHS